MKKYLIVFGIVTFFCFTQFSSNLKSSELSFSQIPADFKFDGCSMFPDGNYIDCCTAHDTDYFFGGSWTKRLQSDNKLRQCVADKGGFAYDILGTTMWTGVRIGGAPVFPTPFRWGFGRDRY